MNFDNLIRFLSSNTISRVALLPHINADADALGSCLALKSILESVYGKTVDILANETPASRSLSYLPGSESVKVYNSSDSYQYDLAIAVDTMSDRVLGETGLLKFSKQLNTISLLTIIFRTQGLMHSKVKTQLEILMPLL